MKTRNPVANCRNCVYGTENADNPLAVDCHRLPAVLVDTAEESDGNVYHQFQFPAHKHGSFCGEHPEFFLPETTDNGTRMATAKVTNQENI